MPDSWLTGRPWICLTAQNLRARPNWPVRLVVLGSYGYRGVLVGYRKTLDDPRFHVDDIWFPCIHLYLPPLPFLTPPHKQEEVSVVTPPALLSSVPTWTQSYCRTHQFLTASVLRNPPVCAPVKLLNWGPVDPVTWANRSDYSACHICYMWDQSSLNMVYHL